MSIKVSDLVIEHRLLQPGQGCRHRATSATFGFLDLAFEGLPQFHVVGNTGPGLLINQEITCLILYNFIHHDEEDL